MATRGWAAAATVVSLAGLLTAFALDRLAPPPSADVARGSEEAFASGLHWREFSGPRKTPERWTSGQAWVHFQNLPGGARSLEVALHHHRQPIVVAVDGAIVGSLRPGETQAEFALSLSTRRDAAVELRTETFLAGDRRRLGAHFDRVALRHARSGAPAPGLLLPGLAALGVLALAARSRATPLGATVLGLAGLAAQAALLWPVGLLRSGYATRLPLLVLAGAALAFGFARWRGKRAGAAAGPWAFASLFCAWLVQAVAMTSPMVVMSDAVLNANKLTQVAACAGASVPLARCAEIGGGFFPVTATQHARPFPNPYPIAFYLLLTPLLWAGADAVTLVRYGAGIAGALSAGAVFSMGEGLPRRAALAVLLLQTLPFTCDAFSYGNLPNVFGQALTLAFLCWWLSPRGGAPAGALLLGAAAFSHFSSFIVLVALVPLLLMLEGPPARVGRAKLSAVFVATVLAALYYVRYLPLIVELLPRLLEGGGSGHRTLGLLDGIVTQVGNALGQWGWPVVVLAALGLPRPSRSDLDRSLAAVWAMGGVLALAAVVSPLEVRYLFAMGFAVSFAAAAGAERLAGAGRWGGALAASLLAWQAFQALSGIHEIVVERYRL